MTSYSDIESFISEKTFEKEIKPDTDIFNELGCTGDDFHELMEAYQQKFSVDMSDYRWYFHANEEGGNFSLGSIFSKPPYERVNRIPVTPQMLWDYAKAGKWGLVYPVHKLPKYRIDIFANQILFLTFLFFCIRSCIK